MREEIVPHVVLDVARDTGQDAAHQEAEHAADDADAQQQRSPSSELSHGHTDSQIVDGVLQDARRRQPHTRRDDDAPEADEELAAVPFDVAERRATGDTAVDLVYRASVD